jgi:uncharacterized damage-inducible protein DinB
MAKKELLEQIRAARLELLAALNGLPDDVLLRPFVVGTWSIKDTLAHLTAWQSELITALSKLHPTRAPAIIDIEDMDEWNDDQYHASVRRALPVVVEDFHGVHKQLLKIIEGLDDRALDDGRRFQWMEGEPLSYLIADNSAHHEQEHAEDIRQWREANNL